MEGEPVQETTAPVAPAVEGGAVAEPEQSQPVNPAEDIPGMEQ